MRRPTSCVLMLKPRGIGRMGALHKHTDGSHSRPARLKAGSPFLQGGTALQLQGLVTYVHHSMRQKAAPQAADAAAPDAAAVAQRRQHLESALTALRLLLEGNPRLSALMASRPFRTASEKRSRSAT